MTTTRARVPFLALCALLAGCTSPSARTACACEHATDASSRVVHVRAADALGPYSGAVMADGLLFLSGKIGAVGGTFAHEASTALDAVEHELRGAGASLADLISVTVYLTDMAHYAEFNAAYAARVPEPWPARTCVAVSALPGGARIEIQAVAKARLQRREVE